MVNLFVTEQSLRVLINVVDISAIFTWMILFFVTSCLFSYTSNSLWKGSSLKGKNIVPSGEILPSSESEIVSFRTGCN